MCPSQNLLNAIGRLMWSSDIPGNISVLLKVAKKEPCWTFDAENRVFWGEIGGVDRSLEISVIYH
jgi:hypothetical protein